MKRENRYSLQRPMLFVVQGMLSMLLCFGTPGCKTSTNRTATSAIAKKALPLTVAPSPTPTLQIKSVPASQPATSLAVVAQPTSRPAQEPLRPGQKDQYGRELLFTFSSLVDGAPISDARVYGDDRPRIVVIRPKNSNERRLFFLDTRLRIQARHTVDGRMIIPAPNGRAVLIKPFSEYRPPHASTDTELLDSSGVRRWRVETLQVPLGKSGKQTTMTPAQMVAAPGLNRVLLKAFSQIYLGMLLLLDGQGKAIAGKIMPAMIDNLIMTSDGSEAVYVKQEYKPQQQKDVYTVVRVRMADLKTLWQTRMAGRVHSLAAGRHLTAIVSENFLVLLDQRGKIKWKKQVASESRIAFWPNDSRLALGGSGITMLDADQGQRVAYFSDGYPRGQYLPDRWGFVIGVYPGFFVVDARGQKLFVAGHWNCVSHFWMIGSTLVGYSDLLCGGGLYRFTSPQWRSFLKHSRGNLHE